MILSDSLNPVNNLALAITGNTNLISFTHAATAARTITFPDTTGTVLLNNNFLGYALPALTTGYLNWTGSAWALTTVSGGSGAVYNVTIGNGSLTTFTITHGLGSLNYTVTLWETTGQLRQVTAGAVISNPTTTQVTVTFTTAPATNGINVVVISGGTTSLTNPMSAVGDFIYGGTSGAPTRLAGPTAAAEYVLTSTGTGSAAQAPVWTLASSLGSSVTVTDVSTGGPFYPVMATTPGGSTLDTASTKIIFNPGTGLLTVGSLTANSGKTTLAACVTGYASLNLPSGTAPTTLVAGDMWITSNRLWYYNGTISQPMDPFTTLGDTDYGGVNGVQTRLAGPTVNGTYALVEIVTASASVAPSWALGTGSGSPVFATSPTLTTPNIGTATGTALTLSNASSVAFLTSTRSDLSASVTFTQTASSNVTLNAGFTATLFTGSGAGLSYGTVADTYTIQNLGTVTTTQSIVIASGRYIRMTLGATVTVNLPLGNASSATEKLIFEVTQGGSGSYSIYWSATRGFPMGVTPALTTTVGAIDLLEFTWNGSYWLLTNFNPNIQCASTATGGYRPSTLTLAGSYISSTNNANMYDTGLTASVDSSTYGTVSATYGANNNTGTFTGFMGVTKSGTLTLRYSSTGTSGSYEVFMQYSTNGGSTWNYFPTSAITSNCSITSNAVALTNVNPTQIQVQVLLTNNGSGTQVQFNVYDVVFI